MTPFSPALLVFAEDWGRHSSGCQQMVPYLLPRHRVCWINTIGTRPPRFDRATWRRGLEKLRHWLGFRRSLDPGNLQVWDPWMWPWLSSGFDRWLNRRLLVWQLGRRIASVPGPAVALTKLPIVADLVGRLPVARWVYYCVDDMTQWPGLDGAALRRLEEDLIKRVDVVIAASAVLQERLASMGRKAHLLTHGVDLEAWQQPDVRPVAGLARLQRPLIVFWGLIDRRLDTAWVQQLDADLRQGTIVLAGPDADPDPALFACQRVFRLPALPHRDLPRLGREAAVLVMPYLDEPVTRAMQPLKLKEYLATGKPAVVRDLPSTRPWADCLDLADSALSFSQMVRQRLASGLPESQQSARGRLAAESWGEKVRQLEQWVFG